MPDAEELEVEKSILLSTKQMLGIEATDTSYDLDIKTHINTAFSVLYQAGVGPLEGVLIKDKDDKWESFTGNRMAIEGVKTYVYFYVKRAFDPPTTSFTQTAIKEQLDELIWRLNVEDDFAYRQLPL